MIDRFPAYDDAESNPRQPLLSHVNSAHVNEKTSESLQLPYHTGDDGEGTPGRPRTMTPPGPARRMFATLILLAGVSFLLWQWHVRREPVVGLEKQETMWADNNSTIDILKKSKFHGIRLAELDARLLPGGEHDAEGHRRLVFVGDIHGCRDELHTLLKEMEFNEKSDHLVAVGDIVSKGPDNVGVLDELIRLGASSVRGNHEDRILKLAPSVLEAESDLEALGKKGKEKDRKILKHLKKHHIKYLQDLPLMLRIPALPLATEATHKSKSPIAEEILVVHAGLVPGIPLDKQDPYFVMNMRSIKTKHHIPLEEAASKGSKPWYDSWNWYNDRLFRKKSVKDFEVWDPIAEDPFSNWAGLLGLKDSKKWPKPQVVVYGHHSKAGLQLNRWSKGLDTGCVRGGKLTAMVLNAYGDWEVKSVGCKDHR